MRCYVVFEGKKPGVYESWDECKKYVNGVSGAIHKSFSSSQEAWEAYNSYLAGEGIQPIVSPVQPTVSPVTRQAPRQEQPGSSSARRLSTSLNTYANTYAVEDAYTSYLAAEGIQPTVSPVQPTVSPVIRQAPRQEHPGSNSARRLSTSLNTYAVEDAYTSYLAAEGIQPTVSPVQPRVSPVIRQALRQEQPGSSSARRLNTYAVEDTYVEDQLKFLQDRVAALEEENTNLRTQLHNSNEYSMKKEADLQSSVAEMMEKLNMK